MTAVTAREPQTARFQEKRDAILNAAAAQFNALGVKGATLAGIAASVGLVTNSVTYYYRKKEDLATACFLRAIVLFDGIAEAAAREATVEARVRVFLAGHAALLAAVALGEHPPVVAFSDVRALPSPQLETVHTAYTGMFRRVRGLLKDEATAHWPREMRNARTHLLLSLVHWLPAWFGRYEPAQYPRMVARVADIVLNGLGAPTSRWEAAALSDEAVLHLPTDNAAMDAFLRAATALLNEQGYRGASVDKISARLNVTKGSFYHHNDNKLDLISACFERTFEVIRRAFDLAEQTGGSGWQRAGLAARMLVRFQLSAEGPLLRLSSTSALPEAADRARIHRTLQQRIERMAAMLVDGLVDGSMRPLDAAIAAQLVVGLINGAAELHRWVPDASEASVVELYVRPIFMGLLGEASTAA
ncbi:TetR/AcrR family transcriptional regulator [Variovorax sp.]|jgi:AcrR family transcriptional regulator|uniref:TetR/AcrR family transcriptional regulator n=1 Tax=Variovorax sp. TaxID=1871043 RepID=UPI0037D99F84